MLKPEQAIEQAKVMLQFRQGERRQLDEARRYLKGRQRLPAVYDPKSGSVIKVLARASRVNVMPIVVNSLVQSMYVDGFRGNDDSEDLKVWGTWQANKMDMRQMGIHRATATFGRGYAIVLPGDPVPVIRGYSPRNMTCLYGEDDDWPVWAFTYEGNNLWRLFDDEAVYYLASGRDDGEFTFIEAREHGAEVTPVVRYVDEDDLDADDEVSDESFSGESARPTIGQVGPLMPIQDQIDITTFGLQVSQNAGAFRQRYVIGWVAENETEQLKASAAKLWAIDEDPDDVTVGEFGQTDLTGYIESREASFRHASALSQTPVHELTATLIQMSAEALAAAEAAKDRKVAERETLAGEAHEQVLWLAGKYQDIDVPHEAQVLWRETSARSFAATVDGLGKLTQMLGVPPQELWEKVPGITKSDVERWKQIADQGNAFSMLAEQLDRQAAEAETPVVPEGA